MSQTQGLLLETHGLRLQASGRVLLDGLHWQVRPGQFWCVLGRNGAGKSTLLHVAAGLQRPAAGRLALAGVDLPEWSPARLALLRGLLLQHQHDAFSLPVVEAVMAGRFAHGAGWGNESEHRRHALQALQQLGLGHMAEADVARLSGGERQRVALATLLAQAPQLYLLDEPTSHQDIAAQLHIMALLRQLAADGAAVVASCHDVNLALHFASHVLLLGEAGHSAGTVTDVMRPDRLDQIYGCRFTRVGEGAQAVLVASSR